MRKYLWGSLADQNYFTRSTDLDTCCKAWPEQSFKLYYFPSFDEVLASSISIDELSCLLCASGCVLYCSGVSNWGSQVLKQAFRGCLTCLCNFSWGKWSSWAPLQETLPGKPSDLTPMCASEHRTRFIQCIFCASQKIYQWIPSAQPDLAVRQTGGCHD